MSPFRERKYLDWFRCLDVDGNGLLERADFERSTKVIAEELGWEDGVPALYRLREAQSAYWEGLLTHIHTAQDAAIIAGEFARFCDDVCQQINQDGQVPPFVLQLAHAYHRALDLDGDGQIDRQEYAAYLRSIGSNAEPSVAFGRLDLDDVGVVTLERMAGLLLGWITAETPEHPGNYLATGRLT